MSIRQIQYVLDIEIQRLHLSDFERSPHQAVRRNCNMQQHKHHYWAKIKNSCKPNIHSDGNGPRENQGLSPSL